MIRKRLDDVWWEYLFNSEPNFNMVGSHPFK